MSETGLDGDARYTMLESIWDYAEEKLAQHGETERYRDRHLDHFIRFAEKAEPELYAAQQAAWLSRISVENFNLNFALRWSLEQGSRIERGLRLAGALSRYWEVRNYLTEARETVAELLARADAAMPPGILAKAEETAGRLAWCQDDDGEALRHYAEAQRLYEIAGNESAWGLVEAFRGFAERNLGHAAEARAHFERAQAAGEKLKIVRLTATAMSGLGSLEADEGNLAGARALKERALEMFQDAGDLWVRGILGWSLGKVCVAQQDYAVARMLLAEALSTIRELGNKWTVPYVLEGLADIGAAQGQVARAVRLYGAASAQREAHGLGFSPAERAEYDVVIARLREQVGDEGFEAEWAAGRALSLQSAVTYVLSGRSDLPERPRRGSRATVG
jgi:tetratricopeptide (TPR) repeat protein